MANNFRIAIIKNGLKIKISDDLEAWAAYEAARSGYRLVFHEYETAVPIAHESFGIRTIAKNEQRELYGLTDIQERIRALGIIPQYVFHAVVFLYDFDQPEFERLHPGASVAHWTRYGELYPGTEFIEIATTKAWDRKQDTFRVLTHEIRHAFVNRARRKGIPVMDVMDLSPVFQNGKVDWIPYYLEFAPTDKNGNRAIQDRLLTGFWDEIASQPALDLLVQRIMSYVKPLMPEKTTPRLLEKFCEAIKKEEGWFIGSRSYRNNSPGNLKWSKYMIGQDPQGFAIFKDYATGWKALLFQVEIAAKGKSTVYRPDMTFYDFFSTYAPANDGNTPKRYAEHVAAYVGVPPTTRIRSLIS